MKVIATSNDEATVKLSQAELNILLSVLSEITDGPNAIRDDADWDMLISHPRAKVNQLADEIEAILK